MAIGERCKSMCKTLSGETIHRAVALTVVAAERTVAAVPASAEAVRTAIGRDNPSGRGRPSGETFHRDLDKSSGETIHRAVAVHRERQSIGTWRVIGKGTPSGRGRPSGDAIHRAVAVAFVPAVETVESVAAMASVAIIAKRYEYVNQRCWPTGNRAYHRQHYPSTKMS